MMKVHEKLTDINQIKAHNIIKETKLKVGLLAECLSAGGLQPYDFSDCVARARSRRTHMALEGHAHPLTHAPLLPSPHPWTVLCHLPAHRVAHLQYHLRQGCQHRVRAGVGGEAAGGRRRGQGGRGPDKWAALHCPLLQRSHAGWAEGKSACQPDTHSACRRVPL